MADQMANLLHEAYFVDGRSAKVILLDVTLNLAFRSLPRIIGVFRDVFPEISARLFATADRRSPIHQNDKDTAFRTLEAATKAVTKCSEGD
tara:strand:+ start:642 stop:914 length:273 start_codon:yes stop_codon:yes gene_type:complete